MAVSQHRCFCLGVVGLDAPHCIEPQRTKQVALLYILFTVVAQWMQIFLVRKVGVKKQSSANAATRVHRLPVYNSFGVLTKCVLSTIPQSDCAKIINALRGIPYCYSSFLFINAGHPQICCVLRSADPNDDAMRDSTAENARCRRILVIAVYSF